MIAGEKNVSPNRFESENKSKVKIPWSEIDKWIESLYLEDKEEALRLEPAEAGDRRN